MEIINTNITIFFTEAYTLSYILTSILYTIFSVNYIIDAKLIYE